MVAASGYRSAASTCPARSTTAPSGPSSRGALIPLWVRAINVLTGVSAANGTRPVTPSTSTSASAYRSARASSGAPVACSGDA